jgi:peptidoglycan/LPS O-acetylase OafA/YrhL
MFAITRRLKSTITPREPPDVGRKSGSAHSPPLDGLRCCAFTAVFVHHALGLPLLWVGVDLFFVLSGYLISGILIRTRTAPGYFRTFYARRALRIMPPYYAVLLFAFGWLYQDQVRSAPWFIFYLSNVNAVWQLAPAPNQLNLMWSLAIEEQFYLLWPLVVAVVPVHRLAAVCGWLFLGASAVRAFCAFTSASHWPAYYLLPARMDLLTAGALVATLEHTRRDWLIGHTRFAGWTALVSTAVFALLAASVPDFRTGSNSLLFNTLGYSLIALAIAAGLVVVRHGSPLGPIQRLLSWPPLRYLGVISYTSYLVHAIVLDRVMALNIGSIGSAGLAWLITIGVASASWFAVERPLQRFKDTYWAYGRSGAAGAKAVL